MLTLLPQSGHEYQPQVNLKAEEDKPMVSGRIGNHNFSCLPSLITQKLIFVNVAY